MLFRKSDDKKFRLGLGDPGNTKQYSEKNETRAQHCGIHSLMMCRLGGWPTRSWIKVLLFVYDTNS